MFPEDTNEAIVKKLDQMEAESYRIYRAMQRLRLHLQERWKVLPTGERWSQEKHDATEYPAK